MDIWGFLKNHLGLPSFPSPRKDLLNYVLNSMLNPPSAQLVVQSYFDKLSYFASLALSLWILQFAVSTVSGIMKGDWGAKMREWMYTGGFLLIGVPLLPGLTIIAQLVLNLMAKFIFLMMLGTTNVKEAVATISHLTGNPAIDFFLGAFQIGILLVLAVDLILVVVALYASDIALVITVALKFLGQFGDNAFKAGLNITIFGIAGNAVALIAMGFVVGFGSLVTQGNPLARGFINIGAFCVALICLHKMLKMIGGQLKATVTGAVAGVGAIKNRIRGGEPTYESNGGDKQNTEASRSHQRHADRKTSITDSRSDTTNGKQADDSSSQRSVDNDEDRQPERRTSSLLARSRTREQSGRRDTDNDRDAGTKRRGRNDRDGRNDGTSDRDGTNVSSRQRTTGNGDGSVARTSDGGTVNGTDSSERPFTHRTPKQDREDRRRT